MILVRQKQYHGGKQARSSLKKKKVERRKKVSERIYESKEDWKVGPVRGRETSLVVRYDLILGPVPKKGGAERGHGL